MSQSTAAASRPRRVAIVFSGGPAPAANAVISAATIALLHDGVEVIGLYHGYSNLIDYDPEQRPLVEGRDYLRLTEAHVNGLRNTRGILIGTSRANPGRHIRGPADLEDEAATAPLRRVYRALVELGIDALVSIGGDDTLKTANFIHAYQQRLPADAPRVRVVHLPKTIDNDYFGIDFTFGFFTAVDFMAREVQNLRADAMATSSWFICETMGRKAGWLSYGVAIAGEATLVISGEDITGSLCREDDPTRVDMAALANRIVDMMLTRENKHNRHYGVVVIAEGISELLPADALEGVPRDEHGHLTLSRIDTAGIVSEAVARAYRDRTGRKKKITGLRLGYEARCATPHAFDVMLGSQLGIGAYRALVEEGLDAHMVSVTGQLDLRFVPFAELIDPESLLAKVRLIRPGSDYHRLACFLESRAEITDDAIPVGRREV